MRTWFVLVMMAAVALSGCAGEGTGFEPTSDPIDDGTGGNETVDSVDAGDGGDADAAAENGTETVENLVPVLSFSADVVNGTAPLLVNFTIDAEDDSEELSWVLSIDGNETYTGTEVPAFANHTFDEGVWNVTLSLTDGEHVVEQSVAIGALAAAPAGPAQTESGEFTGLISGCDNTAGVFGFPGLQGAENERFDLEPSTAGGTFTVDFESDGPALRYYIVYYGEGGSGVGGARPSEDASYSGDIPAAATYFRVAVCGGGETTFTYEGFAPAA